MNNDAFPIKQPFIIMGDSFRTLSIVLLDTHVCYLEAIHLEEKPRKKSWAVLIFESELLVSEGGNKMKGSPVSYWSLGLAALFLKFTGSTVEHTSLFLALLLSFLSHGQYLCFLVWLLNVNMVSNLLFDIYGNDTKPDVYKWPIGFVLKPWKKLKCSSRFQVRCQKRF